MLPDKCESVTAVMIIICTAEGFIRREYFPTVTVSATRETISFSLTLAAHVVLWFRLLLALHKLPVIKKLSSRYSALCTFSADIIR